MTACYFDVTEFIRNPLRTGIQRVVREILKKWPTTNSLQAVEFCSHSQGLVRIDDDSLALAVDFASDPYRSLLEIKAEIKLRSPGEPIQLKSGDVLLNPELFFDPQRALFYANCDPDKIDTSFIIHDLLPWRFPDQFNLRGTSSLNFYLLAISRASKRCFVSSSVRSDYLKLIANLSPYADAGPAIPLGNDGLGVRRAAAPNASKSDYLLCFGAFDGRKSQHIVLQAFLSCRQSKLRLVFAGRVPELVPEKLRSLFETRYSNVEIVADPRDEDLASLVLGARSVLFVSEYEGYGLPAPESLYAGIPVVVHQGLPSVQSIGVGGQIRVDKCDVESVARALCTLTDDHKVESLQAEANRLELQSWNEYVSQLAQWALRSSESS